MPANAHLNSKVLLGKKGLDRFRCDGTVRYLSIGVLLVWLAADLKVVHETMSPEGLSIFLGKLGVVNSPMYDLSKRSTDLAANYNVPICWNVAEHFRL